MRAKKRSAGVFSAKCTKTRGSLRARYLVVVAAAAAAAAAAACSAVLASHDAAAAGSAPATPPGGTGAQLKLGQIQLRPVVACCD